MEVCASAVEYCERRRATGKKGGWLSKFARENELPEVRQVHPALSVQLPQPFTVEAEMHGNFSSHSPVEIPPAYVARLRNARVLKNGGAVVTEDGVLLADVSRMFRGWLDAGPPLTEGLGSSPKRLGGRTAVIATAGKGYYHFLWDSLPRLGLLKLGGHEPGQLDHLIVKKVNFHCRDEMLALLGVDRARLVESHGSSHFAAEELILPSLVNAEGTAAQPGAPYIPAKWVCDFLRASFAPCGSATAEGLYISRRGASKRRVENEAEVEAFLAERGFRAVSLETLSFQEQVDLFNSVRIVAAPHGAGLGNLVFCKPGTRVIEIFPPAEAPPCYWAISAQCGLHYRYFMGDAGNEPESFRISLQKLAPTLETAW